MEETPEKIIEKKTEAEVKAEIEKNLLPEEEDYFKTVLNYILEKLKIVAKDGGTVNIHIDKFFSGIPPNQPPYKP